LAAEHHRRPFGRNSVAAARTAAIIFSDLADIGHDLAHAADIWRSQRRTRWIRSVYRKFFEHIAGGRDVGDVHRRFNTKAGGRPGCERPAPHDQIVADLAKIKTKVYPLNSDDDGFNPARLLILERMLKCIPRAKYAVQAGSKGLMQQVGELVRKYEGSRLRSPGQQAGPRWTSRMRPNRPWDPVSACVARESCPIAGIERKNRPTEFLVTIGKPGRR
jgi:hypothetical protein